MPLGGDRGFHEFWEKFAFDVISWNGRRKTGAVKHVLEWCSHTQDHWKLHDSTLHHNLLKILSVLLFASCFDTVVLPSRDKVRKLIHQIHLLTVLHVLFHDFFFPILLKTFCPFGWSSGPLKPFTPNIQPRSVSWHSFSTWLEKLCPAQSALLQNHPC